MYTFGSMLVFGRSLAGFPFKGFGKIALVVKTGAFGNGGDTFSTFQQVNGSFDFQFQQVLMDAYTCIFIKGTLSRR